MSSSSVCSIKGLLNSIRYFSSIRDDREDVGKEGRVVLPLKHGRMTEGKYTCSLIRLANRKG